ncbi:uncharacterized protein LOC124934965 [Impatiens glandulifera]|uniref:uncharacterized protein LOC124934965 n=1 Tax=Impatiens glandulifera TaxID=253017 RepID=UPI001FB178F4|nr:uncharacterized protein LOC124934965 [Impatiens glandulifera]
MAVEKIVVIVDDDSADGQIQCTNHPYKNINPGAICSFCLQEKLGKLVSSSFPIAIFPSSSSSSSPSFRSNNHNPIQTPTHNNDHSSRRPRIPFLITQRRKNKNNNTSVSGSGGLDFKRSKSTTTPCRSINYDPDSENRRGFWSFLYHSKHRNNKRTEYNKPCNDKNVSRSRSVGCGSRRFSGDFFDRISTGFGDCTLRRVESQREGKTKTTVGHDCMIKERVKCGGIFSGFLMVSSSTEAGDVNGKAPVNRSWGWPLASPIRAFNYKNSSASAYPSSSSSKRGGTVNSNKINLNSTHSIMAVRG